MHEFDWADVESGAARREEIFGESSIMEPSQDMKAPLAVILAALAPSLLAAIGGAIGHGWIGYGFYKIALLILPFAFGAGLFPLRGVTRESARDAIAAGLLLGAAGSVLLWTLLPRLVDPLAVRAAFDVRYRYTPGTAIAAAILIATFNAALEEWFYRGFLDAAGGRGLSLAAFALQHFVIFRGLAGDRPALLVAGAVVVAGATWSHVNRRHGLGAAIASHVLTDALLLVTGLSLLGYFS